MVVKINKIGENELKEKGDSFALLLFLGGLSSNLHGKT